MVKKNSFLVALPLLALLGLTPQSASAGFTIAINPGAALSANSAALAAFNRAANQWATRITDDILITVNANLGAFTNNNIIGSTSAVALQTGYNTVRGALVAKDPTDTLRAALPTAAQFSALVPAGVSLTANIVATKANFKGLGFTGLDGQFGAADGNITFNQAFSFDFDNSNGVGVGLVDFETVAAHEIGHLLGFTSAVDSIDGGATSVSLRPLDLYRFTNGSAPQTLAQFSSATRDLRPGGNTVTATVESAFTVNGVATNQARMSTGVSRGDGRQASHWKDDDITGFNIGVMDPTLDNQVIETVGNNDFVAMRLIGYNVAGVAAAPEPGTLVLFIPGILLVGYVRRRRS